MTWCDKLASTPGVGLKLDYHFMPAEAILHALAPVLDPLVAHDKWKFTIERLEAYRLVVVTNDGFHYGAEPSKLNVTFNHRLRAKQVSAGPPVMELLSSPLPFTTLMPMVSSKLIDAALLVPSPKSRTVTRVGITSTTVVADDEAPPGILRFLQYVGRPWCGSPKHFSIQITADLGGGSGWSDRCIHTLVKTEDPDQLLTINLDWQRTLSTGRPITREALSELVQSAQAPALKYFEDVAEGSRFDEELISKTN